MFGIGGCEEVWSSIFAKLVLKSANNRYCRSLMAMTGSLKA